VYLCISFNLLFFLNEYMKIFLLSLSFLFFLSFTERYLRKPFTQDKRSCLPWFLINEVITLPTALISVTPDALLKDAYWVRNVLYAWGMKTNFLRNGNYRKCQLWAWVNFISDSLSVQFSKDIILLFWISIASLLHLVSYYHG